MPNAIGLRTSGHADKRANHQQRKNDADAPSCRSRHRTILAERFRSRHARSLEPEANPDRSDETKFSALRDPQH
jgi:hypothetical protein